MLSVIESLYINSFCADVLLDNSDSSGLEKKLKQKFGDLNGFD